MPNLKEMTDETLIYAYGGAVKSGSTQIEMVYFAEILRRMSVGHGANAHERKP